MAFVITWTFKPAAGPTPCSRAPWETLVVVVSLSCQIGQHGQACRSRQRYDGQAYPATQSIAQQTFRVMSGEFLSGPNVHRALG